MGTILNFSKLGQLRAKTDRDLFRILNSELDRSLALGNVAASRQSSFYAEASAAYARTRALLSKIAGLDVDQRTVLERKLKELRMALDLVAVSVDSVDIESPETGKEPGDINRRPPLCALC